MIFFRRRRTFLERERYYLMLVDSLEARVEKRFLDDARDDIAHNEAGLGFESLFEHMYEDNARLSHEHVERLIQVSRALGLEFKRYEFLPELEEFPEDAGKVVTPPLPAVPASIQAAADA